MGINTKNQFGGIDISTEAIASVAGRAASECYGVIGLASKNSLVENINEILKSKDDTELLKNIVINPKNYKNTF